jgi:hypothetical protein
MRANRLGCLLTALLGLFAPACIVFWQGAIDGYRSRLERQAPSPLIVWSIKACALEI